MQKTEIELEKWDKTQKWERRNAICHGVLWQPIPSNGYTGNVKI